VLSSGIQIKTAAECALALISTRMANFPPKNSCIGITHMSAYWKEAEEIVNIIKKRQTLFSSTEQDTQIISNIDSTYVRYYVYQKQIIMGFVEKPNWNGTPKEPEIVLTLRDATGKTAWSGSLEYLEKKLESKKVFQESLKIDETTETISRLNTLAATSVINNTAIFEKWNTFKPEKSSFSPYNHPVLPDGVDIIISSSTNETNIPSIDECFSTIYPEIDESETVLRNLEQQYLIEQSVLDRILDTNSKQRQPIDSTSPQFM
jgi:hypothetical protein